MNVIHFIRYRRYKTALDIPENWFKKGKWIKGDVCSVGDADGFRIVHVPLFGSSIKGVTKGVLMKESISVRMAGIDAPECANFGKPGQPYGIVAKNWLTERLLNKRVHIQLLKKDQYSRAVAMVYTKGFFGYTNVCVEMVRLGHAIVYEGKIGEFGTPKVEIQIREAEAYAKKKKLGLWKGAKESPMEYKKRFGS